MKNLNKALLVVLMVVSITSIFAGTVQPATETIRPHKRVPAILKEGSDMTLAVLLGMLTGGTCAVTDFASGGKSMPFTWATSFFIRWKFTQSLGGANSQSQSRCAAASLLASWATYGVAMLLLVIKRNPRV